MLKILFTAILGSVCSHMPEVQYSISPKEAIQVQLIEAYDVHAHHKEPTEMNPCGQYFAQEEYAEAASCYEELILREKEQEGDSHVAITDYYHALALSYSRQGLHEKAEPYYLKAYEMRKKILGENHPSIWRLYNNLGYCYMRQGKYQKAAPILQRNVQPLMQAVGPHHIRIAIQYNNLMVLSQPLDKPEMGAEYAQHITAILAHYPEEVDNPELVTLYENLGAFYFEEHDTDKAQDFLKKGLELHLRARAQQQDVTARIYFKIGMNQIKRKKYKRAAEALQKSLKIQKKIDPNDWQTIRILKDLARCYQKLKNYQRAVSYYQSALEIVTDTQEPRLLEAGVLMNAIVENLINQHLADKTPPGHKIIDMAERALAVHLELRGKKEKETGLAYYHQGLVYQLRGNHKDAIEYYTIFENIAHETNLYSHEIMFNLYKSCFLLFSYEKEFKKALGYNEKMFALLDTYEEADPMDLAEANFDEGATCYLLGLRKRARGAWTKALKLYRDHLDEDHDKIRRTLKYLELTAEPHTLMAFVQEHYVKIVTSILASLGIGAIFIWYCRI